MRRLTDKGFLSRGEAQRPCERGERSSRAVTGGSAAATKPWVELKATAAEGSAGALGDSMKGHGALLSTGAGQFGAVRAGWRISIAIAG